MNELLSYIRNLADALALRDWTFTLSSEPAASGRAAEVVPVRGRRHATLSLGAEWSSLDPSAQRSALVHELLECHHAPARYAAQFVLSAVAPQVLPAFDLNMEYAIDGLADAIAPLFPLPPVPCASLSAPIFASSGQ